MFFARQFPYFAQSVTPGSLCHGNNIAQMPTIRMPDSDGGSCNQIIMLSENWKSAAQKSNRALSQNVPKSPRPKSSGVASWPHHN